MKKNYICHNLSNWALVVSLSTNTFFHATNLLLQLFYFRFIKKYTNLCSSLASNKVLNKDATIILHTLAFIMTSQKSFTTNISWGIPNSYKEDLTISKFFYNIESAW